MTCKLGTLELTCKAGLLEDSPGSVSAALNHPEQ